MSLTAALSNALSGTRAAQSSLAIVSQNISGANQEGYSRKTPKLDVAVFGGVSMGVYFDSVKRAASSTLSAHLSREVSGLERVSTLEEYYKRIENIFGTPDKDVGISSMLTQFSDSLTNYEIDPNSTAAQLQVVTAGSSLADSFRSTTRDLQQIREQADGSITAAVDDMNRLTKEIARLNLEITSAHSEGQAYGDLEDRRDRAVNELAKLIDIRVLPRPNQAVAITTPSGQLLVDNQIVQKFSFRPSPHLQPGYRYTDGLGSPPYGIVLESTPPLVINDRISDGRLRALLDLRDKILPDVQDRIDSLARTVMETVNEIHNQGSSAHPLPKLTGSVPIGMDTDLGSASGMIEFALLNRSTGDASSIVQIDLGALHRLLQAEDPPKPLTPMAIADVINGGSPYAPNVIVHQVPAVPAVPLGLAGAKAGFTPDGRFVLSSVDPNKGVVINERPVVNAASTITSLDSFANRSAPIPPVNGGVFEVAMTDVVSGAETSRIRISLTSISTVGELMDALNGLRPGDILFQSPTSTGGAPGSVGGPGLANGSASLVNGRLVIGASSSRYRLQILANDHGTPGSGAVDMGNPATPAPTSIGPNGRGLSSLFGMNNFFVAEGVGQVPGAYVGSLIAVRPDLKANPSGVAHGTLVATRVGSGAQERIVYRVATNDGAIASAMSKAMTQPLSIDGRDWNSMYNYASDVIVSVSLASSNNGAQLAYQQDLHDNLKQQLTAITGVNMDEELSNLISLQNSYQASARVISVIQELFRELTNMVN